MMETVFWARLVVGILAAWRITHLLAHEDGPADLVVRFRHRLGSRFAGKLLDCFQCLTLWVAAPIAFFVSRGPLEVILTWLALSGAACLLERIGQQPVVFEPGLEEKKGDFQDGMLWPEKGREHPLDADQSAGRRARPERP